MSVLDKARCFEPVARADARILILGSLPGKTSLERGEYYAQPRNAFWRIIGELAGFSPSLPYAERLIRLTETGCALWDVCLEASRSGSLDQNIQTASVLANDFAKFLAAHPAIALICFNGSRAERLYRSKVWPSLPAKAAALRMKRLPSTSPAHAGKSFEQKLACWSGALRRELSGEARFARLST